MVRLLARCAVVVMLMFAAATAATAQSAREPAVEAVITRQLEAFRGNDAAAAFAIASPDIQALFGSSDRFMAMVASGYPQVHRSLSHRFLRLERMPDGRLAQRVLIEGAAGGTVVAVYDMVEIDGVWRINGCVIEKGSDA
jgi:hypothetical protein